MSAALLVKQVRELNASIAAAVAYLEWEATIGRERNQEVIDVLRLMVGPVTRVLMTAEQMRDEQHAATKKPAKKAKAVSR